MSKKFRSALKGMKDTYPSPNPEREAAFLRSLPIQESKKKHLPFLHAANKPLWYSIPAVVMAAVLITAGTGVYQRMGHHNLPSVELPAETQTTTVDGQVYETQQTSASTEYHTNAPSASDAVENVYTDTSTALHTDSNTDSTEAAILQTDATEASHMPENTDIAAPETSSAAQTTDRMTVPPQTATTAVPATVVTMTTPKATTDSVDVITTTSSPDNPPQPSDTEPPYVPEPTLPPSYDPIPEYSDYRVTPAQNYSIIGDVYEWNENNSPPSDSPNTTPPGLQNEGWQELTSKADVVVSVQVNTLYYTLVDDEPYTQIDAIVVGTYKGNLNFGDLISVYEQGGYIPVKTYQSMHSELTGNLASMQDGTLLVKGKASVQVQTGEVYLLFLDYAQDSDIPEGAFVYAGDDNLSRCLKESSYQFAAMDGTFSVNLYDLLKFASANSRISIQLSDSLVNGMFSVQLWDWLLDGTYSIQLPGLLLSS